MGNGDRIRVGVVAGYMAFFEGIMPEGYREEKAEWARRIVRRLQDAGFEPVFPGLIVTREDGMAAGEQFVKSGVDVILVVPTMAAPPEYSWEAVKRMPRTPLIVWDMHEMTEIPDGYTMRDLVRHSNNVGTIMFTNTALRHGRNVQLFVSAERDSRTEAKVFKAIRAGKAASAFLNGRIGLIGKPIDGYVNVTADPGDLAGTFGLQVQDIGSDEFTRTFRQVTDEEIGEKRRWLEEHTRVEAEQDHGFRQSLALTVTLEKLTERYGLLGGAFNCRAEYAAKNPEIGVIGCLGVSCMTSVGKPYTCTGDIVTSLAMIAAKQLGGDILYCECDQIDYVEDYMLMANTGESDFCLSCDKPCVISTRGHSGQPLKGASVFISAKPGPATLVGMSPKKGAKGGWVLVIAPGEILGTRHQELRVGNCMFRFRNGPTPEAFRRWCLAGATHHGSLSSGDLTEELVMFGEMLGIETVVI